MLQFLVRNFIFFQIIDEFETFCGFYIFIVKIFKNCTTLTSKYGYNIIVFNHQHF